jgi:uncharacterized protein YuzE
MRVHFDEQADAVHVRLDESVIVESEEVTPGVILDFNAAGQVVGVELLRVKEHLPLADLKEIRLRIA